MTKRLMISLFALLLSLSVWAQGISNAEEFVAFAQAVTKGEPTTCWRNEDGEVCLLADIDMAKAKKFCTSCGEEKRPSLDFYISRSKLYKFNEGRMPICKECLVKVFRELKAKYSDEVKALYHLCMLFDIYFSKDLVEKSSSNNNYGEEDNLLKSYMKCNFLIIH